MRLAAPEPRRATPSGTTLRERIRAARREPASWRELGYAVLLALVLWLVDAVVVFNAVLLPGLLLVSPVLAGFDRVDVLAWQVDRPAEALPIALIAGPLALVLAAYVVTLVAAAQASLARILLSPAEAVLAARVRSWGGRGFGWSTPSRPSVDGSSVTCTTGCNSDSSH